MTDNIELSASNISKGGAYNWKSQPERLVYLGMCGVWHQFALVGDEKQKIWCEVLSSDLRMLEPTSSEVSHG